MSIVVLVFNVGLVGVREQLEVHPAWAPVLACVGSVLFVRFRILLRILEQVELVKLVEVVELESDFCERDIAEFGNLGCQEDLL